MRLPVALTQVHKWIGLVVGIQVVLWVAGGLVMSAFPIELVRGETRSAAVQPREIAAGEVSPALVERLAAIEGASGFRTIRVLDRLYVEVERIGAPALLLDAVGGSIVDGIDAATAGEVAARDFTGEGSVVAAHWQESKSSEYRGALPVWRVEFDDASKTSIYVSPVNGRITARRNDIWRLYDFFWMLHIMDYKERVDFNHPLLVTASAVALVLSISGFWLLFYRIRLRRRPGDTAASISSQ